jgi:hypothetical protein
VPQAKEVTLLTHGLDQYGRTLADVFLLDGKNVNHELVKDGWCWWYRKYAPGNTELGTPEKDPRKSNQGQSLDLSDLLPMGSKTETSGTSRGPPQLVQWLGLLVLHLVVTDLALGKPTTRRGIG